MFANRNRIPFPPPAAITVQRIRRARSRCHLSWRLVRAAMQAEREAIERVLAQTRWNRRQAAKILRISYKALLNKVIPPPEPDSD